MKQWNLCETKRIVWKILSDQQVPVGGFQFLTSFKVLPQKISKRRRSINKKKANLLLNCKPRTCFVRVSQDLVLSLEQLWYNLRILTACKLPWTPLSPWETSSPVTEKEFPFHLEQGTPRSIDLSSFAASFWARRNYEDAKCGVNERRIRLRHHLKLLHFPALCLELANS